MQLTPHDTHTGGLAFEITREKLVDGAVKFRVVVTEKEGKLSGATRAELGIVKETARPGGPDLTILVRKLPQEKQNGSIVCVFSVDKAPLDNPDLCLIFTISSKVMINGKLRGMPGAEIIYARLKDFVDLKS